MFNKNRIFFLISISIILLASISLVSASELAAADDVGQFSSQTIGEDLSGESIGEDSSYSDLDSSESFSIDENSVALASYNVEPLSDNPKNFTELNNRINGNSNSTVYLDSDYSYTDGDSQFEYGIKITRSLTIEGNGFTLYGNGAKGFNLSSSITVVFKNITFNGFGKYDSEIYNGGAIYSPSSSNKKAINCTFLNCKGYEGGAIYNVDVENCTFVNNSAKSTGGAMYDGFAKFSNFTNNKVLNSGKGGAMYGNYATKCTFVNNTGYRGGALAYTIPTSCTFIDNYASQDGGAVFLENLAMPIVGCIFVNNKAYSEGGAIDTNRYNPINNCTFVNNSANWGGAIHSSSNNTVDNCIFENNSAEAYGGAIRINVNSTVFKVMNSNFTNNKAKKGGAFYSPYTCHELINCNFTSNYASEMGGAVYGGKILFSIFRNNTGSYPNYYNSEVPDYSFEVQYYSEFTYPEFLSVPVRLYAGGVEYFDIPLSIELHTPAGILWNYSCYSGRNWTENLSAGHYNPVFDLKYSCPNNGSYIEAIADIHGTPTVINVENAINGILNFTYEDDRYLIVSLKDNKSNPLAGQEIIIKVNEADDMESLFDYKGTTDQNGLCNISIMDLSPYASSYYLRVGFLGNGTFENVGVKYIEVKVRGKHAEINVSDMNVTVGDDAYLTATISDKDTGEPLANTTVYVSTNNEIREYYINYTTDMNGQIEVSLKNFTGSASYISLYIIVADNPEYELYSYHVYINVTKLETKINATGIELFARQNANYSGILYDENDNPISNAQISVNINGDYAKTVETDENGTFNYYIQTSNLDEGTYSINMNFAGSFKYNSTSLSRSLLIKKYATYINASDIRVIYNSTDELIVTLMNVDTGTPIDEYGLSVSFNGNTSTYVTDENGQIKVQIPILNEGTYPMHISFSSTVCYKATQKDVAVTVSKYITSIIASDLNVLYNETPVFTATLLNESGEPLSGYDVSINFNNGQIINNTVTDENGQFKLDIPVLLAGSYPIYMSFGGKDLLKNCSRTVYLNVNQIITLINASDLRAFYNDAKLIARLTNESGDSLVDLKLSLSIAGFNEWSSKTDSNGQVIFDLSNLPGGNYNASLSFIGNELYTNAYKNITVYIGKLNSSLVCSDIDFLCDEIVKIDVRLVDEFGQAISYENVSLKGNLINQTSFTDGNGDISLVLGDYIQAGTYYVNISFEGNGKYFGIEKTVKVSVEKLNTFIIASDFVSTYGSSDSYVVTLIDQKGNPMVNRMITISIASMTLKNFTDSNGQAKFSLILPPKTWNAKISFAEEEFYHSSERSAMITINKASPNDSTSGGASEISKVSTEIYSYSVEALFNGGKYLTAILNDNDGNPISNALVNINIAGKTFIKITDGNGQVKLLIDFVPKKYTATISFAGDDKYSSSSNKVQIVVNKAKPKILAKKKSFKLKSKIKKYIVTLKDNKNKPIKNVKISLKIKGKTYKAKTNNAGKAIFKIKKLSKKGKFKAVIKYNGNKYYKAIKKTVKLTVK